MRYLITILAVLFLAACSQPESTAPAEAPEAAPAAAPEAPAADSKRALDDILDAQPAEVKARYQYRNPGETLAFFGIEPGMTVVEALPGGGWYSKLLVPYLGSEGELVGANYANDLWPNFSFVTEEYLAQVATWTTTWPQTAQAWRTQDSASISAFVFGALPQEQQGTADAVLFIRALHNMARFDTRDYLGEAFQNAYDVLKPGGIVGVVQHEAPAEAADAWANGSAGYLKRDFVIAKMQAAGFEFVDSSDINQNPNDQPTETDIVWRLPPSFQTSRDNPELKARMEEIGESNRMTLKFRKPA